MVTQPDSPSSSSSSSSSSTSSSSVMDNIFSYDGNIMLAAIISLLVVILFVLLLHLYAKWFLAQARQRRRSSMSASHVLGPTARFHRFHTFTFETTLLDSPTKGLDASIIGSIPVFVYKSEEEEEHRGLECVVCLSVFEENDIGRKLPKCGHGFHVECIDMWLHSHLSCPICRAPVVSETEKKVLLEGVNSTQERTSNGEAAAALAGDDHVSLDDGGDSSRLEIVIEVPSSDKNVVVNDSLSLSAPSSSSSCSMMSQSLQLSCSLKRMLSRNRSSSECNKVYPSSNVHELESYREREREIEEERERDGGT